MHLQNCVLCGPTGDNMQPLHWQHVPPELTADNGCSSLTLACPASCSLLALTKQQSDKYENESFLKCGCGWLQLGWIPRCLQAMISLYLQAWKYNYGEEWPLLPVLEYQQKVHTHTLGEDGDYYVKSRPTAYPLLLHAQLTPVSCYLLHDSKYSLVKFRMYEVSPKSSLVWAMAASTLP